ncbi:MAG: aminopeptidase P family protein [Oscillospiraceae bacterium]|nr:aminopeptidase P family protein [Oscillospiraceae bacterium]
MNNSRLLKLIKTIPENIDAVIIFDSANKRYLTGVNTDDAGTLIITKNSAYFIIDSRYIEVVGCSVTKDINVILQNELHSQIAEIFSEQYVKSFSIETQKTPISVAEKFKKEIKNATLDLSYDAGEAINKLRSLKDQTELELIKAAQKITDDAFEYILPKIKEGKTEKELALELEFYMRSHGADGVSFDIIFIGGANTSMPHGVPSDYKLKHGDLITMDFGADFNGYKSDMTRTVALGAVSDEQKKVYNIVLEAQEKAIEQVKEGMVCSEIDKIARDVIKSYGYGEYFGHALGHSVGLDIHESPNFSPKCDTLLKEGMILSVEPGIYLPKKFGVRIEDLVYVTEKGPINLTKSKKSLIIL